MFVNCEFGLLLAFELPVRISESQKDTQAALFTPPCTRQLAGSTRAASPAGTCNHRLVFNNGHCWTVCGGVENVRDGETSAAEKCSWQPQLGVKFSPKGVWPRWTGMSPPCREARAHPFYHVPLYVHSTWRPSGRTWVDPCFLSPCPNDLLLITLPHLRCNLRQEKKIIKDLNGLRKSWRDKYEMAKMLWGAKTQLRDG